MLPNLPLLLASSLLPALVSSHGALYVPAPRNSIDRNLPGFKNGASETLTPCTCSNGFGGPNASKTGCDRGMRSNGDGQACLWWSQGCSIGCPYCLTDPKHPANHGKIPTTFPGGNPPHADKAGFRIRYCNASDGGGAALPGKATLAREFWTMNVEAVEGSEEDSYRFNPWRAPGSAPVVDACGQAGGKYKQTPVGGDSIFETTKFATMGDLGSKVLPVDATQPVAKWTAGSAVEVAWGIRYNHGGGASSESASVVYCYQYRLCPAGEEPTEACFQRHPLPFDRSKQTLVYNNGTRVPIRGKFVDRGTVPAGSTWARNPIPRTNDDNKGLHDPASCPGPNGRSGPGCTQFPPPAECHDQGPYPWSTDGSGQGACSGDWTLGVIADTVLVPKDLPAGHYVLSWRWDCEETAQGKYCVADSDCEGSEYCMNWAGKQSYDVWLCHGSTAKNDYCMADADCAGDNSYCMKDPSKTPTKAYLCHGAL
eukprot:g4909.t1